MDLGNDSKLESLRIAILQDIQRSNSAMMDKVIREFRDHVLKMQEFSSNSLKSQRSHSLNNLKDSEDENLKKETKSMSFHTFAPKEKLRRRERIFITRDSLLTTLLEVDHMKTMQHLFYIAYFIQILNGLLFEYFEEGRIQFGIDIIRKAFGQFHYVLAVWTFQQIIVMLLFYMFQAWSSIRLQLHRNTSLQRLWSLGCLWVYVGCQIVIFHLGCSVCFKYELPFASALTLQLETVRLMMKMQAFVRTNAVRVINFKLKSDEDLPSAEMDSKGECRVILSFHSYLYFLFAPTLVYRDEYPRTTHIRWSFALKRLLEIVAITFVLALFFKGSMRSSFQMSGVEEWNLAIFLRKVVFIMPSVGTLWFCGFYLLQHAWFNFTSELLRFGDRLFYTSWWNASNYDDYYRQWNIVIYDWLYQYIYRDVYEYVFVGSKWAASLTVFTVSAIFHEIIMCCMLRMFFPVLYLFFGIIGVVLVAFTRMCSKNGGQLVLWFGTVIGSSILVSLYTSEYYARLNSPADYTSFRDYFTPRMLNTYNS